ncbi:hypothetical protein [Phycicoccus flavus]|uniref:hypothetical protein n=1 Tax=Phycicoccus flavus TaxID=2502783 RepID=UPI000FEBC0F5|nr:hypothetical protein [Phycicoccus flavus]NHA69819.1 hypothetical protein [Phycicoccus flavus]
MPRRVALLAGVVVLAAVPSAVWLGTGGPGGPSAGPPTPPVATAPPTPTAPRPEPPRPALVDPDPATARAFAAVRGRLHGEVGLAWVDADGIHRLGGLRTGAAWSTVKVPMSVAALRRPQGDTRDLVTRALRRSDNDAALALWTGLGGGAQAARRVDVVLDRLDSAETRTSSSVSEPPFSPYGQTRWSLTDQARFARALTCRAPRDPVVREVLEEMAQVEPGQRWGLGGVEGARFKGGWGPGADGRYLVRQLGVVGRGGHRVAVALAARADSGVFADGVADLDLLTADVVTVLADRPGYSC